MLEEEETSFRLILSLHISQKYIQLIQGATLDGDKLDEVTLYHLQNPTQESVDTNTPDDQFYFKIFSRQKGQMQSKESLNDVSSYEH